jgi:hypothetical protein
VRKRVAIAVLLIAVIAIVTFVLTRPKEGSVEYHLRQYMTVQRQISQGTLTERSRNVVNRIFRRPGYVGLSVDHFARLEEHRKALIDLGYLEQREFVLSHRPANYVMREHNILIAADPRWKDHGREFLQVSAQGTNVIVIVARREDMPVSVEAVRKADLP